LKRLTAQPRFAITLLMSAYLVLASAYSLVTPLWEASDEQWHYPLVKHLADNRLALPVQRPGELTAWRQEGSQPPLYYMVSAVLTAWIDTSDVDEVRWINPHADIGVLLPDGNYNMAIHDPAREGFPWRGTVLAVHIVRFFSVLLGAVTVLMTWRLARLLFPVQRAIWTGAAAFVAFNPMFLFISGSVNNDNLANALASVLLVQIVGLLQREDAPPLRELVAIGLCVGAGMLAKFNIGFLLPVIALALALLAIRLRDRRVLLVGGLVTGGITVLSAGWWYVRNWQLYGDPTGLNTFLDIVGRRTIPANAAQLWSERHTFLMSYWGFFGGVNVPLPTDFYSLFNGFAALALIGLLLGLAISAARAIRPPDPADTPDRADDDDYPTAPPTPATKLGWALMALWIVVLFAGLLRWTAETWASQGRLMFAAIAPVSVWLAAGLWQVGRVLPLGKKLPIRVAGLWHLIAAMVGAVILYVAYTDPVSRVQPFFLPHEPTPYEGQDRPGGATISQQRPEPTLVRFCEGGDSAPCLLLSHYGTAAAVTVGEFVQFTATMSADQPFSRDWTAFVHLVNAEGLIVAQRDVYPKQGQLATTLIRDSLRWRNRFAVRVPEAAVAPQAVTVVLGFYDRRSGERLRTPDGAEQVIIGDVQLQPRPSALNVPNPLGAAGIIIGGEAALLGYDLTPLVVNAGDSVTVTLHWRGLRPMQADYRVFVQLLEPNTTNVFASSDAMPAAWSRPTSSWAVGEIVVDTHTLAIPADAPLGTWQIAVGIYQLVESPAGNLFRRLRVITPDGSEADDFVYLSRVKIAP
jgi:4-amino-4-deoxy-L-arabinose transferase-like glycosyltransferase